MKQNKNNQPINLEQDIELTIQPDFQSAPFVIVGDAEAVMPIAEAVQAYDKAHPVKDTARAVKAGHTALEAVTERIQPVRERMTMDIRAKLFDIVYHDTSYAELKARRLAERKLQHRQRIGLIVADRCAKHERMLKQVA